jgi:hypothetical protein
MAIEYFKSGDGDMYTYTSVGQEFERDTPFGEKEKRRPYASVSVIHSPSHYVVPYTNKPTTNYRDPNNVTGLSERYLKHIAETIEKIPEEKWTGHEDSANQVMQTLRGGTVEPLDREEMKPHIEGNKYLQPETLFERIPSSIEVDNMLADPSMGHTAITLTALAKRDLGAEKVIASGSLSSFSSHLTKTALDKGLVETNPSNPDAEVTNNIRQHERSVGSQFANNVWGNDRPDKRVSPQMVQGARDDVRQMLRKPKVRNPKPVTSKGLSDQFLPGMEGFV